MVQSSGEESQKPLQAKIILLVVGGLKKVWHAKVVGLYWLLPRVTGTTDPHEGLSGYFYPSDMIRDDEQIVESGNPSRWQFPAPYVIAGFLLLLSAVITVGVPLGYGEPMLDAVTPSVLDLPVPENWWYAPPIFTAGAAVLLAYVVTSRASTWHIITDKRLLHRRNVLDPDRTRLDLADVKSIDTREPIPDRWYGVGYVDIATASTGGKEVTLEAVKHPESIARAIDKARYDRLELVRGARSDEAADSSQQPEEQSAPRERKASKQQQRQAEQDRTRSEPASRPPDEEGASIEEQRPGHTLQDDLDSTTRRDER